MHQGLSVGRLGVGLYGWAGGLLSHQFTNSSSPSLLNILFFSTISVNHYFYLFYSAYSGVTFSFSYSSMFSIFRSFIMLTILSISSSSVKHFISFSFKSLILQPRIWSVCIGRSYHFRLDKSNRVGVHHQSPEEAASSREESLRC